MQQEIDMLMNRMPNNAEAKKLRGYTSAKICFEKYGDAQTGKKYLQMYLEERPNNIPAIGLLGDILSSEKKYEEALLNYERAYTLNPLQKDLVLKICDVLVKMPHKNVKAITDWIKVLKVEYPTNENIHLLEKIVQNTSPYKEESLTDKFYDTISTFNLSPMEKSQNKEFHVKKLETSNRSSLDKAKPLSTKLNFSTSPPKLYSTILNSPNNYDGKTKSHLPPIIFNSPLSTGTDENTMSPSISTSCNGGNIIINLGTSFSNVPILHSEKPLITNNNQIASQKIDDCIDSLPLKDDNIELKQLEAKVLSQNKAMKQMQNFIINLCDTFEQCLPSTKKYFTMAQEQNSAVMKCLQELSKQQSDFSLILNHVFDGLKSVSQIQQLLKEQLMLFNQSANTYNYVGLKADNNNYGHRPASQPQPHQISFNDAHNNAYLNNQYYYPHPDNPYYNPAAQYWQGNLIPHQPLPSTKQSEVKMAPNFSSKGGQASQTLVSVVKSTSSGMTISMGQFQFAPFATKPSTTSSVVSTCNAIVKSEPSSLNTETWPTLNQRSQASNTTTTYNTPKLKNEAKPIFSFKPSQVSTTTTATIFNADPQKSMPPLPSFLHANNMPNAPRMDANLSKDYVVDSLRQDASKFEEYDDNEYEDYEDYDDEDEEEEEEGEYEREDSGVGANIGFPAYPTAAAAPATNKAAGNPYFTHPNPNPSSKGGQGNNGDGWSCEACWIHNPSSQVKCLACEQPKPHTATKPIHSATLEVKAKDVGIMSGVSNIPSAFQFGFTMTTPGQADEPQRDMPINSSSASRNSSDTLGGIKFSGFTFAPTPHNASADDRNLSLVSQDSDVYGDNGALTSPRKGAPPPQDTYTGEENEVVLFEERAKLYRFDFETKEWKERGVGQFKILTEREGASGGKTRIILRRDHVYKLACNHYIAPGHTKLKPFPSDSTRTKFSWHALDFAQPDAIEGGVNSESGGGRNELFTVKFKTPEVGAKFREVFEQGQTLSGDKRDETPPTSGGKIEKGSKEVVPSTPSSGSTVGGAGEGSDVSIVYENKPTPGQLSRAKALQLSPYFYTYENSPSTKHPHAGCKGCVYSDEEGEEEGRGDEKEEENDDQCKASSQQQKLVKIAPDDGHLIDEGTGEDILFNERAKLYRFNTQINEWKERGLGQMLVLLQPSDSKCRLLFRREAIFKIACNHVIDANLKLQPFGKTNNTWAWRALDFAEPEYEQGVEEKFAIKFKNGDIAGKFKEVVNLCAQRKPPRSLNTSNMPNVESLNLKENIKETSFSPASTVSSDAKGSAFIAPVFGSVPNTCLGPTPDFASLFQKAHKESIISSPSSTTAITTATPLSFNFGPSKLSVSKSAASPSFSTTLGNTAAATPSAASIKFAFSKTTTLTTTAPSAITSSTSTTFQYSASPSPFTFGLGGGSTTNKEVTPKAPAHYSTPLDGKSLSSTHPVHSPNESSLVIADKVFGTGHNLSFAALANNALDKDITTQEKDTKKVEQFYDPCASSSPFGSINPELLKPRPVFGSATPKAIVKPTRFPPPSRDGREGGSASRADPDEENENNEGDDEDSSSNKVEMSYKPIVDLVNVNTGEENEIAIFNERAKLFRFDNDTHEWKERGVGQFKILRDKEGTAKKYRLLLRREQIHKIACNHRLTPHLQFNPFPNDPKGTAVSWQTIDFAENEDTATPSPGKREFFTVKFRNQDILKAFKETIEKCQEDMKSS